MKPGGKVISWNICQACNYHCSYCVQGKNHHGFPAAADIEKIRAFFCSLGAGWEIKISGGEPFLYPNFLGIVRSLCEAGVAISVVTNFSFPRKMYREFIEICGDRLCSFSASLHLEHTGWREFLEKCIWVKQKIDSIASASLVVNSVVQPGQVQEVYAIKKAFEAQAIRFYPQLKKVKGQAVGYSLAEQLIIGEMAGDKNPFVINAGYSCKGALCYAGMHYFIVTQEGQCYTCYPGKRDGTGYMGSITTGDLQLRKEPIVCPYAVCPCTVPINRGMVSRFISYSGTASGYGHTHAGIIDPMIF